MFRFVFRFLNPVYVIVCAFILCWWWIAFHRSWEARALFISQPTTSSALVQLVDLSSLKRSDLHQALSGNTSLMGRLINEWASDASLLVERGVTGVQQLSKDDYIFSQNFLSASKEEIPTKLRFLPQTHFAATLLLALVSPDQIVALPKGMRDHPRLYPAEIIKQIPLNTERYQSEEIFAAHPNLAFVASYSDPSMLKMLKRQGVELCTINPISSLSEMKEVVLKMGDHCDSPSKAKLLSIFIDAAMINIDNRLRALSQLSEKNCLSKSLVYLNAYQQTSIPTRKSLSGQLLQRVLTHHDSFSCLIPDSQSMWSIPFGYEQIYQLKPDYIIISSMHSQRQTQFTQPVFYLDYLVQDSPTQYLILAYFDLFSILATLP